MSILCDIEDIAPKVSGPADINLLSHRIARLAGKYLVSLRNFRLLHRSCQFVGVWRVEPSSE